MIIAEKTIILDDEDFQESFPITSKIIDSLKPDVFDEYLTADIVIYNGMIVKNRLGKTTNQH